MNIAASAVEGFDLHQPTSAPRDEMSIQTNLHAHVGVQRTGMLKSTRTPHQLT
ncbi:hypothetical protein [Nevskia soli]|uniref:hypothetical protein n=1 Tax=Nevskia soli TaxID=418856 RepID=UPI0014701155|nr:hypothetical protein [Nevskia soli]